MADGLLPGPPQLFQVAVGLAIDNVVGVGRGLEVANGVAHRFWSANRGRQMVVTDVAGRPVERIDMTVNAAEKRNLCAGRRLDVNERIASGAWPVAGTSEIAGPGSAAAIAPKLQ